MKLKPIKNIALFLVLSILLPLSSFSQQYTDLIILKNNDSIWCQIELEYAGMISCKTDKRTVKIIAVNDISQIHLSKTNKINLNHIINNDGYISESPVSLNPVLPEQSVDSLDKFQYSLLQSGIYLQNSVSKTLTALILTIVGSGIVILTLPLTITLYHFAGLGIGIGMGIAAIAVGIDALLDIKRAGKEIESAAKQYRLNVTD